jgi:hemin uptake protein HemP
MKEQKNDPRDSSPVSEYPVESSRVAAPAVPPASNSEFCENPDDRCRLCREMEARVVRSDDLLQGQRELLIMHGGSVYRLIRTRNDKLILQK